MKIHIRRTSSSGFFGFAVVPLCIAFIFGIQLSAATAFAQSGAAPDGPSNLEATSMSQTRIDLTWIDNSSGESLTVIQRSSDGITDWEQITTVPNRVTHYADTSLTCGKIYYYRATARKEEDNSDFSNIVSTTPDACPPRPAPRPTTASAAAGPAMSGKMATPSSLTPSNAQWNVMAFAGHVVYAVALSPDYPSDHTILVGSGSKVYRSTTGGQSWTVASIELYGLAFSPDFTNDHTVYGVAHSGLYRSIDEGVSWNVTGLSGKDFAVNSVIAISPTYASDQTIFVGALDGHMYRSVDRGDHWDDLGVLNSGYGVQAVVISPDYSTDHTVFAGIGNTDWYSGGVYRSIDSGETWSAVNVGLGAQQVHALAISPNYATDHTVFVANWAGSVYRTQDSGDNWSSAASGILPNTRPQTFAVSPDYASDNTIFHGTFGEDYNGGIFESEDGGSNWAAINSGLNTHWAYWSYALAISSGYTTDDTLFDATIAGLYTTGPVVQPAMVVNSNLDGSLSTINGNGTCDLREAIINSNNLDQSGSIECPMGVGNELITFAGDYTITLKSQLPVITSLIEIVGNGQYSTIIQANAKSGAATFRVMEVASSGSATVKDLTIRNGRCNGACATDTLSGGGIFNDGQLVLDHVLMTGNSATWGAAVFNNEGATSVLQNDASIGDAKSPNKALNSGGGIYNYHGEVTVDNSTIGGNSARWGGGILNDGISTVTIQNNTAIGKSGAPNTASVSGGGIYNDGTLVIDTGSSISSNSAFWGGGIYSDTSFGAASTVIDNSTVGGSLAGNQATFGGGIYLDGGSTLAIQNSTFVSNNAATSHTRGANGHGGGIYLASASTATIDNSTIKNNYADSYMSGTSAGGAGIYLDSVIAAVTIQNSTTITNNVATGHGGTHGYGAGIQSFGSVTMNGSRIIGNTASSTGGAVWSGNELTPDPVADITGSCILGNSATAFDNTSASMQTATGNWWGDPSGPGPIGPSVNGDTVSPNVNYSGFLASSILDCPDTARSAAVLDMSSLAFGDQAVKTTSLAQTVTVSNIGAAPLIVSSLKVSTGAPFAIAGQTCSSPVVSGDSCTIDVVFKPISTGPLTGSVNIASNSLSSPDTIALSGNGRAGMPALSTPKNDSASYTQIPKFSWKAAPGATSYHFQIDTAPTFDSSSGSPLFETDVTGTKYTWAGSPSLLPYGTYYWRAQAVDPIGGLAYTLPFSFDVTLLKTPSKNGATSAHLPKFAWQAVKTATLPYHIKIWDSTGCGNVLMWEDDAPKPAYVVPAGHELDLETYYWQVTADGGGTYTPCWRFDITTLKTPKANSVLTKLPAKFSWTANKAASGYQLTVTLEPDDGSGNVVKIDHKPVTSPAYTATVSDGLGYGRYIWSIEEIVLGVPGPKTPDFIFFVTNMSKPINNTLLLDSTPTFSWKAIRGESGYTLEISEDPDFGTILHSHDAGNKTSFTVPPADALGQGVYYWRVITTGAGNFTMPGWSFTVGP